MDIRRRFPLSPLQLFTPSRSPREERTPGATPTPGSTPRRASGPLAGLSKGVSALFKADPEKVALKRAFSMAETGKADPLAILLQSHPHLAVAVNANGTNLLASAAKRGHLEVVQLMLARPESPLLINQTNKHGETPLQRAVEAGRVTVVEALLRHAEIAPNVVDKHGQTPLHVAAGKRHAGIARALVAHPSTDVNLQDRDRNTALHVAVRKRGADVAGVLLGHPHVDPNLSNAKHHTPLTMAIAKLHVDCVHALVGHASVEVNRPGRADSLPPIWQAVGQFVKHLESGSFARHGVRTGKELDCLFELARSPHIDLNALGPGGHTPLTRLVSAKPHRYVQAGRDTAVMEVQHGQRVLAAVSVLLDGSTKGRDDFRQRSSQGRDDVRPVGSEARNGFHPNARNIDGEAAIQIALRNGNDKLASRLLRDPRTDPGAVVTRLIRDPGRLSRLLKPGAPEPKTNAAGVAFVVEQLDRAIRFRNPDGTANPWVSLALCEYAARFQITDEAQRYASVKDKSCLPNAASYAAQGLEFSIAFRQAPTMRVAARELLHHAPMDQAHFNLGGVDVSRSEVEAWAAGQVPEVILNARIEQHVRDGRANVHADGLLQRGQQLLEEMKRRTPEDQRRSVDQSAGDLRAVIGQRTTQCKQALKAEANQEALETLAMLEAFETVEAMEAMAAQQIEEAEEEQDADEAEEAKEDAAAEARAQTDAEQQKARLNGRIADLRSAAKGIKHLLKMGPTKEDPDYAFRANVALADTWSYVQSRQDPALKANLTAALLLRLADIGKDVPCNTGCIQRVAFASEGIDASLHHAEPTRDAMYGEIVSIAKAVNERYQALYGDVEAVDPAAPGTSSALPVTAHDRDAIVQYTKGEEIRDDVVNDVKRDMVRAAVLADLVERRGWTREKVVDVLAPVLDNVEYLDALTVVSSKSPHVHEGP
ncbi:ankyrin repeat domain-containing protein [Ralstonia solanacearum]|uniref:ankyrin repeat domain-containing protein n=1 Tax=Ralstonia solanacearum TaxID=305 RepID=UPI0005C4E010|nr:ankyrin repeat domain-containing protein [Ralstonia solanacearum]MBB6592276.1 ankyrin repeat domain-containing protein [Ralstonia solanacearum]MBB6596501.1 ankyrin repeat domain-containing protein [Ralstonia solanacearum]MDB0543447.1 ankyrin repeat domain-containing protein [Ralstonia solanacearum]MDB0553011.1 ankyrin repeat domain-containing protein [Ralstonia solanacearum]MDB0558415.1 ankyrin repeat domain-containing protein [Ralstonia solanacearum]